jgi:hypothetical protein
MLLFECSIFATFVPQILMFVGYLSCLLLPGYCNTDHFSENNQHQIEYSKADIQKPTSFENYTISFDTIILNATDLKSEPTCKKVVSSVFPKHTPKIFQRIGFTFFSRPPPLT